MELYILDLLKIIFLLRKKQYKNRHCFCYVGNFASVHVKEMLDCKSAGS
jgi:hypothetical protein